MIEYYKRVVKEEEFKNLKSCSDGCWVRVVDPDRKEIKFLVEKFGLDRDNIMDGLDVNETPRIEDEGKFVYVFLRLPRYRKDISTSSFLLVLAKNNIITISNDNLGMFDKLTISDNFLTDRSTWCLLQILSYISKSFNLKVLKIMKEVKKDKRNILKLNNKDILDLVLQEDILNDYLSSFSPLIDIHNKMLKTKVIKFREDEKDIIEDLIVDLNQTLHTCIMALKSISNMRDYYSTMISNKMNTTLSILTIFTIFLTVPAVFSSIYGMNINLPAQNNPFIFWILSGMIMFIWMIAFFFLKNKLPS